jgi:hypothetical protein
VTGWINEKMIVATDENYRDASNLQGKLQKHQAFTGEIQANKKMVDSALKVSELTKDLGQHCCHKLFNRAENRGFLKCPVRLLGTRFTNAISCFEPGPQETFKKTPSRVRLLSQI